MEQNLDRFKFKVARFENEKFDCFLDSEIYLYQDGTLHNAGQFDFELSQNETQEIYFKPIFSTGLKDKNGKLIYEMDILQFTSPNIKAVVYFDDFTCSTKLQPIDVWGMHYGEGRHLTRNLVSSATILGNRFQNPELLEKQ